MESNNQSSIRSPRASQATNQSTIKRKSVSIVPLKFNFPGGQQVTGKEKRMITLCLDNIHMAPESQLLEMITDKIEQNDKLLTPHSPKTPTINVQTKRLKNGRN